MPRLLPLFFPFSHGFHAKQCFHLAVISFSQRTYSPSWPPVFRLSFPSLATLPLSLPWLELSAHFPSCNLRPTRTRRAWTDSSPGRIFTDVVATASQTYRTCKQHSSTFFPPISRRDASVSIPSFSQTLLSFNSIFHEKGIAKKGREREVDITDGE